MTLAQPPQTNGAATPSPAANGEEGHALKQAETRFDGSEVLELTQFAEKQAWIEEKIQFLASLPPADAVTPDPPARSPTTTAQLEDWWQEHDRIEQEVDLYDMGDLARLKTFAKTASKQHLSPRDTDLIEITLTTLFALDKLLHLLRNRRKALTLLQYRLQWEEQVAAAWEGHRAILGDIPTFLAQCRWTPQAPTDLGSSTSSILPPSTSSASSSQASAMSRTMRSEILSLELARSKSRIHALTSTIIPSTAKSLDKLIDTSPSPLPDSFLDEQDRLEDGAKELTRGLADFLVDMSKQWKASDELFSEARKVREAAEAMEREVEEALLKLPQRPCAEAFGARDRTLRRNLEDGRARLARKGAVSTPRHGAAPEQVVENDQLLATLRQSFASAEAALNSSTNRVQRYRFAVETLERAQAIRAETERSAVALEHFVTEAAQLSSRPNLDDERCLAPTPSELAFDAQHASLSTAVAPILASAPQLLRDASTIIVDLNKAGIDPNIRRATKETMQRMRDAQAQAQRCLDDGAEQRARLDAARALARALEDAEKRVAEARGVTLDAIGASRWRPDVPLPSLPPLDAVLDDLRQGLDASLTSPLAHSSKLLVPSHSTLHSHLQSRASTLRFSIEEVHRLSAIASDLQAQSRATSSVLSDVRSVESTLREAIDSGTSDLAKLRAEWGQGEMDERRRKIEADIEAVGVRLQNLISVAHTRIPFLASPPSAERIFPISSAEPSPLPPCLVDLPAPSPLPTLTPLPFDLSESDDVARKAVNEATAAASGRVEELRRLLALLVHQQQASAWDLRCAEAETELGALEKESLKLHEQFKAKSSDPEDALTPLNEAATALTSRCSPSLNALTALSESLVALRASPSATDDLFRSRIETRQPSIDDLQAQHSSLTASLASLQASIAQTSTAQQEGEAAEQRPELPSLPSFVLDESHYTPDNETSGLDSNGLPLHPEPPSNGLRRSRSSGRSAFVSAEDLEDVFGKKVSDPPDPFDQSPTNEPAEVSSLRDQLDTVVVDVWLDSDVVLHLPTVTEVDNLRQDLSVIEDELEALSTGVALWVDLDTLKKELERKSSVLGRVSSLARFNDKLVGADSALSNLLNSIDATSSDPIPAQNDPFAIPLPSSTTPLADALLAAGAAVTIVRKAAIPLIDDPRIKSHVERVEEAYGEMTAMVDDLERRPPSSSGSASGLGTARPAPSTPRQQSRSSTRTLSRPTSSASTNSSRRSSRGDAPSAPPSRPSSTASRQSTFSLKTPTRRSSLAPSPTPTPRRRTSSATPLATPRASLSTPRPTSTIPRGFSFGSTSKRSAREDLSRSMSSIPTPTSRRVSLGSSASLSASTSRRGSTPFPRRDSIASSLQSSTSSRRISEAFASPSRYSKASLEEQRRRSSTFSPPRVKTAYKANPSRKVDVEIGRIVNELEIHVPISAADGAYSDESGMYWIGEADTGRLYFCRILRSKTVMVRVGGGWQGLLPFIISHFGSAEVTISPRVSPSTSLQANDPHWISSGSLSASQSSTSSLANYLSVSTSSSLLSSSTSFGRRTVSGGATPLRRSTRSSFGRLPTNATPKAPKPLPQWKP